MIQRIKAKIYAFCFWQTRCGEFLNKIYDLRLFYKFSFKSTGNSDEENLRASLTKEYHIIEKGLSLHEPRIGFGKVKIPLVIRQALIYYEKYGDKDGLTQSIKDSLQEYLVFNREKGENLATPFYQSIQQFVTGTEKRYLGGTKKMIKTDIEEAVRIDYKRFIEQRVSVRDFSTEEISKDEIIKAINIAKNAPSVCNRQSWKSHIYANKEDIKTLLKYQHGNSGFGETIKVLILITTDIKAFTNLESNEVFIDGGIFSMSLILALHAVGLCSCAMNTCIPYVDEKKLKELGNIPANERLIMMLGVGKLKDEFKVPISLKKETEQIAFFH